MQDVCQTRHLLATIHLCNCTAVPIVRSKSKITAFHTYSSFPDEHTRGVCPKIMQSPVQAIEERFRTQYCEMGTTFKKNTYIYIYKFPIYFALTVQLHQ